MDVVAAYRDVGTFRGAAAMWGMDPKTVKRKVLAQEAGELDEDIQEHRQQHDEDEPEDGQGAIPEDTEQHRARSFL